MSLDSQESVLTDHELLAVTVGDGERGRGGLDVEVEAPGEGVQVGQVGGTRPGDPLPELVLVGGVGASIAAKDPIRLARVFISGQADATRPVVSRWASFRVYQLAEQELGGLAR